MAKGRIAVTARDKTIIRFLEDFRFATSTQLAQLFFKQGSLRAAQRRLQLLYNHKHLKRFERAEKGFSEYVYCVTERNKQQAEHYLGITEMYKNLSLLPGKVNFIPHYLGTFAAKGKRWRFIADALVTYYRPSPVGGGRLFFLEFERRDYGRTYPKLKHYEAYYASRAWEGEDWSRGGRVFPAIVIVADPQLLARIRRQVARRNPQAPWQFLLPSELATWLEKR